MANQPALTGDTIVLFFFRLFLTWVQFRLASQILSLKAFRSFRYVQKEKNNKKKKINSVGSASVAGPQATSRSASWDQRCYNSPFSFVCLSSLLFRMAPQFMSLKASTSYLLLKSNGTFYRRSLNYFSIDGLSLEFELDRQRAKFSRAWRRWPKTHFLPNPSKVFSTRAEFAHLLKNS